MEGIADIMAMRCFGDYRDMDTINVGKARGPGGIPIKLIKNDFLEVVEITMFTKCLRAGDIPRK